MGAARRKKQKGHYHHGDLARALVDVAITLTERHGIEAWTLAQAAAALGVSPAAPYRHYANRQELLNAVALEGLGRLRDALLAGCAKSDAPLEQVHAVAYEVVRFAIEEPALYRITFSGARPNTLASLAAAPEDSAFGTLRSMIAGWQARGLFSPGDPLMIGLVLWSATHGLAMLLASGRLAERARAKKLCRETIELLLAGLATAP